jgi:hypothetical protein
MSNWIDLSRHNAAAWRTQFGIQILPIAAGREISGVEDDPAFEAAGFRIERNPNGMVTEIAFGDRLAPSLTGQKAPLPPLKAIMKLFPGCQIRAMDTMLLTTDITRRPTQPHIPATQWLWEVALDDIRPDSVMLVPLDSDDLPLRLFMTTQEAGLIYADAGQIKLAQRESEPRYFLQQEPCGGYWAISRPGLRGVSSERLARLRSESSPAFRFAWRQAEAAQEAPPADEPQVSNEQAVEPLAIASAPGVAPTEEVADAGADVVNVAEGGEAPTEEADDSAPGEGQTITDYGEKIGGARKDKYALADLRTTAFQGFSSALARMRHLTAGKEEEARTELREFQHRTIRDSLMPAIPVRALRGMIADGYDPLVLAFREFLRAKMPLRLEQMIEYNWGWRSKRRSRSSYYGADIVGEAAELCADLCKKLDAVLLDPETTFVGMMDAYTADVIADGKLTPADYMVSPHQSAHHIGHGHTLAWASQYESIFPALSWLLMSRDSEDRRTMGYEPVRLHRGFYNALTVAQGFGAHLHGKSFCDAHRYMWDTRLYGGSSESPAADQVAANKQDFWNTFTNSVRAVDDSERRILEVAGLKTSTSTEKKAPAEGEEEGLEKTEPRRIQLLDGRKAPLPPRYESLKREGPQRRTGDETIAPEVLAQTFGFRAIEWGNWVTQPERAAILNLAYDSFSDMAEALGVSPQFMGYHGRLAVSFGARGRGGHAAAHYEPGHVVLHLTKTMGAGTVAHEWAHALDHFLADRLGLGRYTFMTKAPKSEVERTDAGRALMRFMEAMKSHKALEEAAGEGLGGKSFDAYQKQVLLALEGLFDQEWSDAFLYRLQSISSDTDPREALARVTSFVNFVAEQHVMTVKQGFYSWPSLLRGTTFDRDRIEKSFLNHHGADDEASMLVAKAAAQALSFRKFANLHKRLHGAARSAQVGDRTTFYANSCLLDLKREEPYWSSNVEILARGFSSVIHDRMGEQGILNDFASLYSAPGGFGAGYIVSPNPEGKEREVIAISARPFIEQVQAVAEEMTAEAASNETMSAGMAPA